MYQNHSESSLTWIPYTDVVSMTFKLNLSDDWLQKRQGLALPILLPTTPEACQYFFRKVHEYAALASNEGKGKVDYEALACEWNRTADGKYRFYVTTEVLATYAKTWEKSSNICALQELILDRLQDISRSAQIFLAPNQPFPSYLKGVPSSVQPSQGVLELRDAPSLKIPPSISTRLPELPYRIHQYLKFCQHHWCAAPPKHWQLTS